jgi:flagellin
VSALQNEIGRITNAVEFNGVNVLGSTGTLTFHIGADAGTDHRVDVSIVDVSADGSVAVALAATVATQTGARSAMDRVDGALDRISEIRAEFGTVQNRFESTVRNLQNVSENLSASRSRIMDADFAAETANLTRAQILQQAGTAMLAQANSLPQSVLSLLG